MSSYTDADVAAHRLNDRSSSSSSSSSNFIEHRLKMICFDQLSPKPHDFYLNRSERTIFFFCLILLIVYWKWICLSYPMVNDVYAKDDYFRRELQVEQDNIRYQKKEFEQLLADVKRQLNPNDLSCRRCHYLVYQIDSEQIFRILDNQQHVKQEYDECLFPLQSMLILLCLLDNVLIVFVFQQAIELFLLSNVLLVICLGIYAELFIQDRPSVFYTLMIAVFISLFTVYLLFHVLKTFVIIRHVQRIRVNSKNLQLEDFL